MNYRACPQCGSHECGVAACRFTGAKNPIRVRGLLFRDEDDAHDFFEQRDLDDHETTAS